MTKVILFGYRDWANKIFESLKEIPNIQIIDVIKSQEEYLQKINTISLNTDILLFIGWSWIISADITSKFLCLGIHPSDLPNYRGGSPIQHQIIDGILKSKVTLMTLSSEKLDAGNVWLKEDLDLSGNNMDEVFTNISNSSIKLMKNFFDLYPNIQDSKQDTAKGSYFKRRLACESEINKNDFKEKELLYLFNKIRSLTSPYPNAFISDENGNKLFFTGVKYVKNEL